MTVRPAAEQDLEAIVELRLENGRWHARLDPWRHRVPEHGAVRAYFRDVLGGLVPEVHVLVAEMGGQVTGMCELVISQPHADHQIGSERRTAQVHTVIHAEHRGAGAGRALVASAQELAEQLAIDELVAPVLLANRRAFEFYGDQGFASYGQLLAKQLNSDER